VREGKWQGTKVPITWSWQKLSHGVEVKFNQRDLKQGHMLTFTARDQLTSVLEKIDGRTLTLRHAANRTAGDAVVRHDDSAAIQTTVDRAVKEKRNVFFPAGWYRVSQGIRVHAAGAVCLEGASGVDTVMDVSDGATSVFSVQGCTEVTYNGPAIHASSYTVRTSFPSNTVTGCVEPVKLDSYGSETSLFKDNLVTRGETMGVKSAVEVRGMFRLTGNHISGFDEKGSAGLSLVADPVGRTARSLYRDNIFEKCSHAVTENGKPLEKSHAR